MGNGKSIKLWQDAILGKSPPYLPRLHHWMTEMVYKTIWDIYEWDTKFPNRWAGWALPNCTEDLEPEKNMLLTHLAGLAPIAKSRKD